MTSVDKEVINRLHSLSECCICLMTYKDPRMLPCIHTACLKCFEDIQSKNDKNPGDVLPCPLCRKEFTIPSEGMKGLQKNFFIESLMEVRKNLDRKSVPCNTCSMMEESSDVTEATMRCLNCDENYCLRCSKMHTSQKVAREHRIVEINREFNEEEIRERHPVRKCKRHSDKPLDYYCGECKTVVCVSCYVVDHQTHICKEVETIDENFRKKIQESSEEISDCKSQMSSKKTDMERQRREFLEKTLETENAIRSKSQELKSLIDQHTQIVLDKLFLLKQKHQKKMETEIEEIERKLTVLESFVTYCTELKSKGSPSEVCDCAENLISRAKELSDENINYLSSQIIPAVIGFTATDQNVLLQNVSNVVGELSDSAKEFMNCAIVIGRSDGVSIYNEVLKINLNRKKEISHLQQLPTEMKMEAAAAGYDDSIFVTGIGKKCDEIWRLDATSSNWKKCASMVQGRRRHTVAFVDHVLYICGGYVDSNKSTLDVVEAYDTIDDKCFTVGKLVNAVESSGNCVPYKASLYIFGGYDVNDKILSNVQVYDTKRNICSLLSKPMPKAHGLLRVAMWESTAIIIGQIVCLMYNFETEEWDVRDRFKTGVDHFGMTIDNGKIFLFGGGNWTSDASGKKNWFRRSDVRYISVVDFLKDTPSSWKHYAELPRSSLIFSYGTIDFLA